MSISIEVNEFADLIKRIRSIYPEASDNTNSDWVYQFFEVVNSTSINIHGPRLLVKIYNGETLVFDHAESNVWDIYRCGTDCIVKYNNFVFYDRLLIDLNTDKILYDNLEKLALKNLDDKGLYMTIIGHERAVNGHPRVPQCNQLVSSDVFTVPVTQIFDIVRVGDVFISYNSNDYYRGSMMGKPYDTRFKYVKYTTSPEHERDVLTVDQYPASKKQKYN